MEASVLLLFPIALFIFFPQEASENCICRFTAFNQGILLEIFHYCQPRQESKLNTPRFISCIVG